MEKIMNKKLYYKNLIWEAKLNVYYNKIVTKGFQQKIPKKSIHSPS